MMNLDRVAGAIMAAGVLIALALHMRPEPPQIGRYTFRVSGNWIQRFDTLTGEALICNRERCIAADEDGGREAYPANESMNETLARWDYEADRETEPRDPLPRR